MKHVFITVLLLIMTISIYAHGTSYKILSSNAVCIQVLYENGTPITNAEVLVFPPNETEIAYSTLSNEEGVFFITPDAPGAWILQVRTADGHGMRINLPITKALTAEPVYSTGIPYPSKILMAGCVMWGAVGTALFLKSKRKE